MKKSVLMAGLAVAIGLGVLSVARAQGMQGQGMMGHGMMGQGMGMMHGDGQGMDMAQRLEGADADGDGLISRDEIVARLTERAAERIAPRADRMIANHDSDGDGMLSTEEVKAAHGGRMFERLDADGDGAISREEFAAMREMRQKMQAQGRGGMHGMGHHSQMGYGNGHGGYGHGGQNQPGVVIHQHFHSGN